MREYIAQRLAEMKNPEERFLLKEVLNDVFLPLYDATEEKYAALEQRVRDELPLARDAYTVYSTVLPRERVDGKHSYLSAVIPEEAEEPVINVKDIIDAGQPVNTKDIIGAGQPVIETVFCEADYLRCRQITRDRQILGGAFVVGRERYPFKCRLIQSGKYRRQAEKLYSAFLRNDVPWATVNSAYFGKFFDVCLTEVIKKPPVSVKILPDQVEIEFASYTGIVKRGLIPVWNIDKYKVKGEDFPMPAANALNYEYSFDTRQLGSDCGFLVDCDNAYILHTSRKDSLLTVVSPVKKEMTWDMYRFRRRQDTTVDFYPYPIISNARKDSFSARLTAHYGTHITTKAEMVKLMDSFAVSEHMELTDIHFSGEKLSGETYDMNPFITDEIRDPDFQKTLVLSFRAKNRDFFLNRDIASFLVSEFQAVYPEFRCTGVLT